MKIWKSHWATKEPHKYVQTKENSKHTIKNLYAFALNIISSPLTLQLLLTIAGKAALAAIGVVRFLPSIDVGNEGIVPPRLLRVILVRVLPMIIVVLINGHAPRYLLQRRWQP